ncbi:MAPEG family protein [Paracoccus sp. (in: a-proteobacteria)]|uniref:MAPEG family protein n=1 Tax=Paracoccus sp. TaxID=267 RepID=UPI0026E000F7|nr:MAPEG family protein [Paracoccus sp. (in: a-proteobacteria)]MDO5646714.1 MAPEG family protein [Paracoccus sp. (in: a-proteobacteria)]
MTAELTVLALAALWQAVQIAVAGVAQNRDTGVDWNLGPRDRAPDLSPLTGRLRRAVSNHFESLIFFTIAVVVVTQSGAASAITTMAAWLYLVARLLYLPAYAYGWKPWRSVIWAVGFGATLLMLGAALLSSV